MEEEEEEEKEDKPKAEPDDERGGRRQHNQDATVCGELGLGGRVEEMGRRSYRKTRSHLFGVCLVENLLNVLKSERNRRNSW